MLSNTATPKYYGEFRDAVMRGEIPVCREIAMEMNRIDAMIENPDFYYDDHAIDGYVMFCENELTLTDGGDLYLLPTFKLWAESILSWFYFADRDVWVPGKDGEPGYFTVKKVKLRLKHKQYLIVARGGAKSMYASTIQNYILNISTATTHQITTAPTMKQAEEVMSPIRTAITRSRGPLFKFLTEGSLQNTTGNRWMRAKLASTKKGIENFLTGSLLEIRPMTINKLQGLRTFCNTIDEWLSGDIREDVISAIEQGASKHDNYIIIAISSEGTVRNGAGDTIKLELMQILKQEFKADDVSIWYYRLDDISEVGDPAMWPKAQPNLGYTVSYEVYMRDVERAENAPAARNDILAKRFNIPMEGLTYFFTYEETKVKRYRNWDGNVCVVGADLSQGDDFCAFTFLFPRSDGKFGVKTRSYITSRTYDKLPGAMRFKYDQFIEEGTLVVMEGTVLDVDGLVYEDLFAFMQEHQYEPLAFGYDPYNAAAFLAKWIIDHGEFGVVKVQQGVRTETVPLGEIKHLTEQDELLFDELLMSWAMGNAITMEDTNGNRKLLKRRQDQKIDNVAALIDAWVAFKLNKEAFE